jgi:hypothetical protein
VTGPLLAGYAVSGGAPPATLESLRVFADGRARAIVTNAWPFGAPQDEAGLYETSLDESRLSLVRGLVGDPELRAAAGEAGPIRADSGRSSIVLGDNEATIVWGAFATPPERVAHAAAVLRDILATVREHPVAAVRLGLHTAADGGLELELSNPGTEPISTSLLLAGAALPRVASVEPNGGSPLPLSLYRAAREVDLPDGALPDGALAGGERRRVRIEAPISAGPTDALVAFAPLTLELPVEGRPVRLDGLLITRPATQGTSKNTAQ